MFAKGPSEAFYFELEKVPFPALSVKEKCEVVSTLVAPILALVAIGLTVYFALRPLPPLVPVTPNFGLSLPLFVCAATGGVSTLVFVVQMVRHKALKRPFENFLGQSYNCAYAQKALRSILHPGARSTRLNAAIEHGGFKQVSFQTRGEGVKLKGYWFQAKESNDQTKTVIYFHGSTMTVDRINANWIHYYKELNCNILLVEYRGYEGSEGAAGERTQEIETYLDAEAAYKFAVVTKNVKGEVIAHGRGVGGAYAAALGHFFGVPKVILESTFTKLSDLFSYRTSCSPEFSEKAVAASYDKVRLERDADIPGSLDLVTDGFDTLTKIQDMLGEVFVIQGSKDEDIDDQSAEKLIYARYSHDQEKREAHLYCADSLCENTLFPFLYGKGGDRLNSFLTET